jgi:hypothetical protein
MPHHNVPLHEAIQAELEAAIPFCSRLVVLEILRPRNVHYAILGVIPQLGTCVYTLFDIEREPNDGEPERCSPMPIPATHLAEGGIIVPDCYSTKEEDFPSPYRVQPDMVDKCMEILDQ